MIKREGIFDLLERSPALKRRVLLEMVATRTRIQAVENHDDSATLQLLDILEEHMHDY